MTKHEFLQALEAGLAKASPDERAAALQYYTEYLDEAGPDHEAEVLEELGNPEKIAADILAASDGQAEGDWAPPNPPPPLGEALKTAGESLWQAGGEIWGRVKEEFTGDEDAEKPEGEEAAEAPGNDSQPYPVPVPDDKAYNKKNTGIAKTILIILLIIFLFPLFGGIIGVLTGGVGVVAGVLIAIVTLFFCPFILGVALLAAGIVSIVFGALLTPFTLGSGLLNIGLGVLLVGLGLMACYGGIRLLGITLPRIVRWFVNIVSSLVSAVINFVRRLFNKGPKQEDEHHG